VPLLALLSLIAVAGSSCLVMWLNRHILRQRYVEPVILTKGHVVLASALVGFAVASSIVVGAVGRSELRSEREARVQADIRSLADRTLTKRQVAGLAQAQVMLAEPSTKEQLARINGALKVCATHQSCRKAFVQTVNRIVRSPAGRLFTPAPRPGSTPPIPPPKTIIVQGRPGPMGAPGTSGTPGRQGAPGKPGGPGEVNSNIVDGLDNRVADLESALQSVVSRVQVLDKLVAALCRLLTPGKC
jgi:hypothetical protein